MELRHAERVYQSCKRAHIDDDGACQVERAAYAKERQTFTEKTGMTYVVPIREPWVFLDASGKKVRCELLRAPELTDDAKIELLWWCVDACEKRGLKAIAKPDQMPIVTDFLFGTKEHIAAMRYLPQQCLPYDKPPVTETKGTLLPPGKDGKVPECLNALYKNGRCPE